MNVENEIETTELDLTVVHSEVKGAQKRKSETTVPLDQLVQIGENEVDS